MRVNNNNNLSLNQVVTSTSTSASSTTRINNLHRYNTHVKNDGRRRRKKGGGEWNWGVVVGTAVVTALVPSLLVCGGIVLRQGKVMFPYASFTQLVIVPALMFSFWNFLGPVTRVLLGVFTYRTITLTGAILLALAVSISSQSYNLNIFYFTFSILGGIGGGLVLNPGAILLNRSFDRRNKTYATGICLFLGSVFQMLLPHVMTFIGDNFTPSGFFLILGGILFNICVSGMLFRTNDVPKKTPNININNNKNNVEIRHMYALNPSGHGTICKKIRNFSKTPVHRRARHISKGLPGETILSPAVLRLSRPRTYSTGSTKSTLPDIPEENEPIDDETCESISLTGDNNVINCENNDTSSIRRKVRRVRTISNSSTISKIGNLPDKKTCQLGVCSNILYVIAIVANCIQTVVYPNVILYATISAYQLGFSPHQVAFLLSVYVIADMKARLLVAWILPKGYLRAQFMLIVFGIASSASIWGIFQTSYFPVICVGIGFYGFSNGAYAVIMPSVIFEYVGSRRFSSSLSLSQIIQGIAFLFITPVFGVIIDLTKDTTYVFYVAISLHLFAVVLWLVEPIFLDQKPVREGPYLVNRSTKINGTTTTATNGSTKVYRVVVRKS